MRYFIPDSDDSTGSGSSRVPSVMDNDPNADEQVIDQQADNSSEDNYLKAVDRSGEPAKIAPDDLAESIAYALDGSGPGPTGEKPDVDGHKPITEGVTGAGPDEEEEALKKMLGLKPKK